MATTYLTRTIGTPTLNTKYTISFWIKKASVGDIFVIDGRDDASNRFKIAFGTTGTIECFNYHGGSPTIEFTTTRVFRDTSSFYHMLLAVDTTDATAGDRFKFYVNGVRETSFSSSTNPSLSDANNVINESGNTVTIGAYNSGSGNTYYFDGVLSHFYFIDGTAYAPTVFGETDSTTGQWKINTSPSITMGTNGFTILKDGNTITDQSSNSNDFTLGGGTLSNTEDCPSDVFCTLNPLYNQTTGQGVSLTKGNTRCEYTPNSSRSAFGTIAPSSGKYYFECKPYNNTTMVVGIVNMAWSNINGASGYAYHDDALNFGYDLNGNKTSGGSSSSFGSALNNNDIVQVAMDLDNSKLYFGINGTWQSSGDPTSGSTGTGSAYNLASGANYTAACRMRNGTDLDFNFGNGSFRGTAISSEGTNASGIGVFEYDVPTGYTALSTKGLNL